MSKPRLLAVIACAALLCLSVVSPAVGGPSIGSVAKTAKEALRTANSTKTALKRSYNRTHPTEVVSVDGGEQTALPGGFAEWDIKCPRGGAVTGTSIGYGALDPTSDLSYGTGVIISLYNPSNTDAYSGFAEVHCVWATHDAQAAASTMNRAEALRVSRELKRDARGVTAVASKSCGSGYTHAVMPDGSHKCLRAGQFCSRKRAWQRVYHRYGLHCKVNGHLTYW